MGRLTKTAGSTALAATAVLVSAPLALGWVNARNTGESQAIPGSAVTLQATICPSNQDRNGILLDCGPGNTNPPNNGGWFNGSSGQAMVAFRVPTQSDAPDALTPVLGVGANAATIGAISAAITLPSFTRNATYESELARLAPTPPDQRWVGYVSSEFNFTPGDDVALIKVTGLFPLKQAANGGPFVRPFRSRTVVGGRLTGGGNSAPGDGVACGNNLTAFNGTTVCANTPGAAALGTDEQLDTRDLGILADAATATAVPGALATLPFSLVYSGLADDQATFELTATTTLPGATTEVSPSSFTPTTDETENVDVSVSVPKSAQPGEYDVVLTATSAAETRTATGKLTVDPSKGSTLRITSAKPTSVRWTQSQLRGFLQIKGTSTQSGRVTLLLNKRGTRLTSKGRSPSITRSVTRRFNVGNGSYSRRIPLPKGFVPGSYAAAASPTDQDGTALPQITKAFTLKAPPEGAVQEGYASAGKATRRVTRFSRRPRIMYANFTFAKGAQPLSRTKAQRRKYKLTVRWFLGSKAVGKAVPKPNRRKVSSFVRLKSRAPLPGGRYKAVLKAGKRTVETVAVRVG